MYINLSTKINNILHLIILEIIIKKRACQNARNSNLSDPQILKSNSEFHTYIRPSLGGIIHDVHLFIVSSDTNAVRGARVKRVSRSPPVWLCRFYSAHVSSFSRSAHSVSPVGHHDTAFSLLLLFSRGKKTLAEAPHKYLITRKIDA